MANADRPLALITGASAGIGEAFARAYAARGYDLALTARRIDRLENLAAELAQRHRIDVMAIPADLADRDAPALILDSIAQADRSIDVLVNNAGYGLPGDYVGTSWADQQKFLDVMVTAVCALAHPCAIDMKRRGKGAIINIASVAGLVPPGPGHTLYGATKALVVRFSQSLNQELAGTGVHVTAVCPGLTWTEFHDVNGVRASMGKIPNSAYQTAEAVVEEALAASAANRPVIVTGKQNRFIVGLLRLMPEDMAMREVAKRSKAFRRRD